MNVVPTSVQNLWSPARIQADLRNRAVPSEAAREESEAMGAIFLETSALTGRDWAGGESLKGLREFLSRLRVGEVRN